MKNYKLEGIKPFNSFLFRTCYYHQLITGLSCFDIPFEDFLTCSYVFAQKNFQINKNYINEKKAEKILGYKNKSCNLSVHAIIKNIKKGRPILVGVDCFDLKNRTDTYMKEHRLHFILVYGYDASKNEFNIIEHDYINSFLYTEKNIAADTLLKANRNLINSSLNKKKTCHVLIKKKPALKKISPIKLYGADVLKQSFCNSANNLNELKKMISRNLENVKEQYLIISQYLKDLKEFYTMLYFMPNYFKEENIKICISELINGYSNLLSVIWRSQQKNDYDFIARNSNQIILRLDTVLENENKFYKYLMRKEQCL